MQNIQEQTLDRLEVRCPGPQHQMHKYVWLWTLTLTLTVPLYLPLDPRPGPQMHKYVCLWTLDLVLVLSPTLALILALVLALMQTSAPVARKLALACIGTSCSQVSLELHVVQGLDSAMGATALQLSKGTGGRHTAHKPMSEPPLCGA